MAKGTSKAELYKKFMEAPMTDKEIDVANEKFEPTQRIITNLDKIINSNYGNQEPSNKAATFSEAVQMLCARGIKKEKRGEKHRPRIAPDPIFEL